VAVASFELWAVIGSLRYCQGPTGRVRYWLSVESPDDEPEHAVIEYFDLD
jgi:hypothetical protein